MQDRLTQGDPTDAEGGPSGGPRGAILVEILENGQGLLKAKAWLKEETEPKEWTLEITHAVPHLNGAPGIYAMSPQSKKKVYFDNLKIFSN